MSKTNTKLDLSSDKEGYLLQVKDVKKKGEWTKLYFRLSGGSLYFYTSDKKNRAKGLIRLNGVQVEESKVDTFSAFQISYGTERILLTTRDSAEIKNWIEAITKNLKKDHVSLPMQGEGSPKTGLMFKVKKNIAGKAASSSMGKSVMKKVLTDELKQLISCIKNIIAVESGSKELADKLEHNTIKLAVKGYFLWENGTVTIEEFQKIEPPLKQSLKILLAVFDHLEKIKDPKMREMVLDEKFTVVAVLLDNVREILTKVLQPHLTTKSMNRVYETFTKIANRDFLLRAWSDPTLKDDVAHVIRFVRAYVQNM
jgi:hypothetical protein